MNIKHVVQKLVSVHKTNNPFEIAIQSNIIILETNLGNIKGFYKYIKRRKFILINNALSASEQKVICGHELGHAVLHPKLNYSFFRPYTLVTTDKLEKEANLFCSHLLLPDMILQSYVGFTYEQISAIAELPVSYLTIR